MIKQSLKTITASDPYSKMFLIIGFFLGSAYHIFNANGRDLMTNVVSALSSPELFYLIFSISGIFLGIRNTLKGSITGEVSLITQNFAIFPIQTVIEAMKSLTALLLGLIVPLTAYTSEFGLVLLLFILTVSGTNFFLAMLLHYSYKDTKMSDWANTEFRIMNALIAVIFSGFFYYRFIY